MNILWKAARVFSTTLVALSVCWSASQGLTNVAVAQGNTNGHGGQMPAYYDDALFTVSMFEVPASDPLLAHNPVLNTIYATNDLDDPQDFFPVIDAIQGDGFNPLWRQVLIVGARRQFFSDEDVLDAAADGEIMLVPTDEVYRCSVVGRKK